MHGARADLRAEGREQRAGGDQNQTRGQEKSGEKTVNLTKTVREHFIKKIKRQKKAFCIKKINIAYF